MLEVVPTAEQRRQVNEQLSRVSKRQIRIGQAVFVTFTLMNLVAVVYFAQTQPSAVPVPVLCWGGALRIAAMSGQSIFAEFRKGYVEPEPVPEVISQCQTKLAWCVFRGVCYAAAAIMTIVGSAVFWYVYDQLFAPIAVSLLAMAGAACMITRTVREEKIIQWQVWEFIDAEGSQKA